MSKHIINHNQKFTGRGRGNGHSTRLQVDQTAVPGNHRLFTLEARRVTEKPPTAAGRDVNPAAGGEPLSSSGGSPPHSCHAFVSKVYQVLFPSGRLALRHAVFQCLECCSCQRHFQPTEFDSGLAEISAVGPHSSSGKCGEACWRSIHGEENRFSILLPFTPVPLRGHVPQKYVEAMNFQKCGTRSS